MRAFTVTAGGRIASALLLVALVASGMPVQAADEPHTFVDWKTVPQSQAPDRLAEVVCELETLLSQQAILVLPLQMQAPRPADTWNLHGYLTKTLDGLLKADGMMVVDAAACMGQIRGIEGRYDKLAPKLVIELAKAAKASLVLAPMTLKGGKPAIQFTAYEGRTGKPKQMLVVNLKPTDLDYLACTPPANRAFIQWCERNYDKKIDRGECWDVPAKGIPAVGSSWGPDGFDFGRQLDVGETPFPGDPLATKDRRHTMVTYEFKGEGKITILHQNWNWGAESGRKIGWGSGTLDGHDFWRVRPRQGEKFEDILVAARARPKQQRGVTKPKVQRVEQQPARDAAPKPTEAAALSPE